MVPKGVNISVGGEVEDYLKVVNDSFFWAFIVSCWAWKPNHTPLISLTLSFINVYKVNREWWANSERVYTRGGLNCFRKRFPPPPRSVGAWQKRSTRCVWSLERTSLDLYSTVFPEKQTMWRQQPLLLVINQCYVAPARTRQLRPLCLKKSLQVVPWWKITHLHSR